MAGAKHKRSIIFRRVFPSLRGMIERSREVYNPEGAEHAKDSYNEQLHRWRFEDGKSVEFGAVQHENDLKKFQGQPHDYIGIDEATEIPERYVRFLMGWNRPATGDPSQHCQVGLTFNPPMDEEGEWVVRFFAPWIDEAYPDPALDGEIRYVAHFDDADHFYRSPDDIPEEIRERLQKLAGRGKEWRGLLKKRTFFHAYLSDNPVMVEAGYASTIEALPEPLRSALKGDFNAARRPDPRQLIPAAWVVAAQRRWDALQTSTPDGDTAAGDTAAGVARALGVDAARGGDDSTVIAPLYADRFGEFVEYQGEITDSGSKAAILVYSMWDRSAPIAVDIGGGAECYEALQANGAKPVPFNGANRSDATDRSGLLRFINTRAEAYWRLREALDPEGDILLALPSHPLLKADLCAPRWKMTVRGIQIEEKDEIKKRLRRSPDYGDAAAMAVWAATRPQPTFMIRSL